MADLATLKSRIASELHRTDLTAQIAYAITDAINEYQGQRFAFNQTQGTFATVAGTEYYTNLTDIGEIDAIKGAYSGVDLVLKPEAWVVLESIRTSTTIRSRPTRWAWWRNRIRLYPVPEAVYTMTVSYLQKVDVPATAGASNIWTTEAEELIRCATKRRVYAEFIWDYDNAKIAAGAEATQFARLKRELNQLETGALVGAW